MNLPAYRKNWDSDTEWKPQNHCRRARVRSRLPCPGRSSPYCREPSPISPHIQFPKSPGPHCALMYQPASAHPWRIVGLGIRAQRSRGECPRRRAAHVGPPRLVSTLVRLPPLLCQQTPVVSRLRADRRGSPLPGQNSATQDPMARHRMMALDSTCRYI